MENAKCEICGSPLKLTEKGKEEGIKLCVICYLKNGIKKISGT